MLRTLRQKVVQDLWHSYRKQTVQMQTIENKLFAMGVRELYLDHFAIIDLPGLKTGIHLLKPIFAALGYQFKGEDYLAEKQNPFAWLCEENSEIQTAKETLPQVVVADFRIDELPSEVKKIIIKYANLAPLFPYEKMIQSMMHLNEEKISFLFSLLSHYFLGRDWPLPTVKEFKMVRSFNELLAWVLVFGRRPNHFTLSVHLLDAFSNLQSFSDFVEQEIKLTLNRDGGVIKGGEHTGIAQGSTIGVVENVRLADGVIQIPTGFVEFVWRYPQSQHAVSAKQPILWKDYFTGFIAQHANRVIESLYTRES